MYFGVEPEGEKPYNEQDVGECIHLKLSEPPHDPLKPALHPWNRLEALIR